MSHKTVIATKTGGRPFAIPCEPRVFINKDKRFLTSAFDMATGETVVLEMTKRQIIMIKEFSMFSPRRNRPLVIRFVKREAYLALSNMNDVRDGDMDSIDMVTDYIESSLGLK